MSKILTKDELVSVMYAKKWGRVHAHDDALRARVAELEQMLTGRTISCSSCNETAQQRDALLAAANEWKRCEGGNIFL